MLGDGGGAEVGVTGLAGFSASVLCHEKLVLRILWML